MRFRSVLGQPREASSKMKASILGAIFHQKSMKNRGCVADAFLERFWRALGAKRQRRGNLPPSLLGAIFAQKSEKMRQGSRKGPQSPKKRHLKIDVKNCIEQLRKSMPKGSQNDAKMEPKIIDFSCFFEKRRKCTKPLYL